MERRGNYCHYQVLGSGQPTNGVINNSPRLKIYYALEYKGTIILSVSVSPYPPLVEIVQISDFGYMSNALFND